MKPHRWRCQRKKGSAALLWDCAGQGVSTMQQLRGAGGDIGGRNRIAALCARRGRRDQRRLRMGTDGPGRKEVTILAINDGSALAS